jgi:hypothetical protein
VRACLEVTARNAALGFKPRYEAEWEKDGFVSAEAVYLRPFSYAEGGIGVGIPERPSVFIVANPVGSYFKPGSSSAVTTERVRATPKGTGWIKCDSNYVISALAKKEAENAGLHGSPLPRCRSIAGTSRKARPATPSSTSSRASSSRPSSAIPSFPASRARASSSSRGPGRQGFRAQDSDTRKCSPTPAKCSSPAPPPASPSSSP